MALISGFTFEIGNNRYEHFRRAGDCTWETLALMSQNTNGPRDWVPVNNTLIAELLETIYKLENGIR